MIPRNYISVQRRVAEAVSARLHYDYLCFKGRMMDEAYLVQSVADILGAFFDQQTFEIRKNYVHPYLDGGGKGRKPEIDYAVIHRQSNTIQMAIEAKWAGSSHCTPENILWDLMRLKILRDSNPSCIGAFLIAGHKNKMDKCFGAPFFAPGTQHPLQHGNPRKKIFSLIANRDHQPFITAQTNIWIHKYPSLVIAPSLTTVLEDPTKSANEINRFTAKTWIVY
ncbi:hypothetical protein SAMN05216229_10359 [Geopseudomonas sagittaria]|uniref:Restriction endonuclease n=2 Tax=Geopseudomonas sagittaria TaxID=1135990 RepID=A0A1I5QYK4_9GAMM|nr:hypothetical protein SAMN05216229_10359 [Pseudomonas sagittaria]